MEPLILKHNVTVTWLDRLFSSIATHNFTLRMKPWMWNEMCVLLNNIQMCNLIMSPVFSGKECQLLLPNNNQPPAERDREWQRKAGSKGDTGTRRDEVCGLFYTLLYVLSDNTVQSQVLCQMSIKWPTAWLYHLHQTKTRSLRLPGYS